ncbi:type IV secretory system conjugative DNA transfer family protein [Tenacibaculum finnmarkense]|uniref:type IV secretory system conjugative DNA transfer family protein n=1 Tax=Tenacibaculum finnmarkense TaxID=2781243 RepID=UPI001EFAB846|nr:type IV secretory system conjugative DNA transfer family protein [Tenacibaculum finnmarkense]MCG8226374.1 type IV secretory system conjugative DNA transfer family protein [Tenacibaculum finnmarkense genomovar finnmarkense]
MEESKELSKMYSFLQISIYFVIVLEFLVFLPIDIDIIETFQNKLSRLPIYDNLIYSKLSIFTLICIVSLGTKAKKDLDFNFKNKIILPIVGGLFIIATSVFMYSNNIFPGSLFTLTTNHIIYILLSVIGTVMIHISLDNVSKIIKASFMKDRFNVDNESFEQPKDKVNNTFKGVISSVNIPMLFYYNKKVHNGFLNIQNVFRGLLVVGTPGSGKTFGVIIPYMKQLLLGGYTGLIYDYKYPALGEIAFHQYKIAKVNNPLLKFHVVNLSDVERSRRVNPLHPRYLKTMAQCTETSEMMIRSLTRSESSKGGSDQFFTQSAINYFTAIIYFFSKYEDGKYSSFPHILYFLSKGYKEMFDVLYENEELEELLSTFKESYQNESYSQLDGQIGTLRVNLSKLASKELAFIFTGDDIELRVSDPKNPSILILANSEETQATNSASNGLILNRLIKLINQDNGLPSTIIGDEFPTTYFYKVDNLIATARSRKVAVCLGIQEIPQLVSNYGKDTSDKITSVIGNIISGSARKKETLEWLQQIFGKIKQQKTSLSINSNKTSVSLSEQMDFLIPASKISNLNMGEVVGQIANEVGEFDGQYKLGSYKCKINLDLKAISEEEELYTLPKPYYDFGTEEQREKFLSDYYKNIKLDINKIVSKFKKE